VEREYQLIGAALRRVTAPRGWETRFVVPVVGRTSTTFALQRVTNGKSAGRHKGVDIAAPQGRRINAAQDGEVVLAEDFNMHGRTIIIDHGEGVCSLYLHCAEIWVQPGQQVRQGDAIGSVGSTGVATGPHLHWGVYIYGTAVSPMFWTK
jgi:murein DD-endopeptidase MepM/ murein hydrolase activator NlpD